MTAEPGVRPRTVARGAAAALTVLGLAAPAGAGALDQGQESPPKVVVVPNPEAPPAPAE